MSEIPAHAVIYEKRGFSVIPILRRDKKSLIAWQDYQWRHTTEKEITAWWTRWPEASVGIVTGTISGLIVIDLDTPEAKNKLKELVPGFDFAMVPRSWTGKGWQLFFKHPGVTLPNVRIPGQTSMNRVSLLRRLPNESIPQRNDLVPGVLLDRGVLMKTEFRYKGPLRKIGFRYSGPPWVFVVVALCLVTAVWRALW